MYQASAPALNFLLLFVTFHSFLQMETTLKEPDAPIKVTDLYEQNSVRFKGFV